jgi:GTP cyclohydrolase FolE2
MPTTNPRINLTLRPQLAATIRRLSELQGMSMSRTIVQLLEVTEPALQRTCAAIEAVQKLEGEAKTTMLATVLRELRHFDDLALSTTGQPGLFDQMEHAAIDAVARQHGVAIPAVKPPKTRRRRKRAKPK